MANNAWDEMMGTMNRHRWEERRPAYPAATGFGSSLTNLIAADMGRDTPFETLSKGMTRHKRMNALKQARSEGLDPTQGESYYERMRELLEEAGDYDGANRAYQRSITARTEHDARLASNASRPFIEESAELAIQTARQNVPERVHERNMEKIREEALLRMQGEIAKNGTSSKSGKVTDPVTSDSVTGYLHGHLLNEDSPFNKMFELGNPELSGLLTAIRGVREPFSADGQKELKDIITGPAAEAYVNRVMTKATEIQKKHPEMSQQAAITAAAADLSKHSEFVTQDGRRGFIHNATNEKFIIDNDGTIRPLEVRAAETQRERPPYVDVAGQNQQRTPPVPERTALDTRSAREIARENMHEEAAAIVRQVVELGVELGLNVKDFFGDFLFPLEQPSRFNKEDMPGK